MPLNAGRLRHRIVLQRLEATQDEYGAPVEGFVEFGQAWAELSDYGGREIQGGGGIVPETTTRITLRYRDDVTSTTRFVHDGRNFDTIRLERDPSQREFLVAFCKEIPADG